MPSILRQLKNESGISLVLVLVMIALLGLSAGIAGSTWSSLTSRAREADLLWKGGQIRKAIGFYYESSHGSLTNKIYPSEFEFLLKDPRSLTTKRHLRRPYPDPMTGLDWELIKDPGGRIKGVRSTLAKKPFKEGDFSEENKDFEGRGLYTEWEFIYTPKKNASVAAGTPAGSNPQPSTGTESPTDKNAPPTENGDPPTENAEPPQG